MSTNITDNNPKNKVEKKPSKKSKEIKIDTSRTLPDNCSVIVIGEKFVGKSSIINRLMNKGFNEEYDESIHDPYNCERKYMLKDRYINNCCLEKEDLNESDHKLEHLYFHEMENEQKIEDELKEDIVKAGKYETHNFRLVDTGDFWTYNLSHENDLKNANCIVFVYALNEKKTFQKIPEVYKKVKELNSEITNMILVGNKLDLRDERKVSTLEGENLAEELGFNFLETSAKIKYNTDKIFNIFIDNEFKKKKEKKRETCCNCF